MLQGCFKHFAKNSEFSEDIRRLPKIYGAFEKFRKLVGILVLHSLVLFPKFSREFPSIQQRRHESLTLLPVTNRSLIFFMYVVNK